MQRQWRGALKRVPASRAPTLTKAPKACTCAQNVPQDANVTSPFGTCNSKMSAPGHPESIYQLRERLPKISGRELKCLLYTSLHRLRITMGSAFASSKGFI